MMAILDFESEQFYFFDLQNTPMLPTRFESIGLLVQEKK